MSDSCDSMDYSLPGSSVHGIFQARILGVGRLLFSTKRDLPNPGIEPVAKCEEELKSLLMKVKEESENLA